MTFLRKHDFSKKTIIPFCTHGGGGFGMMENEIKKECPHSRIVSGMAVIGNDGQELLETWINELKNSYL